MKFFASLFSFFLLADNETLFLRATGEKVCLLCVTAIANFCGDFVSFSGIRIKFADFAVSWRLWTRIDSPSFLSVVTFVTLEIKGLPPIVESSVVFFGLASSKTLQYF
jgi:hypothetical protein